MSNTTPLMLGLAGGLALWHFAPRPLLRNASGRRDASSETYSAFTLVTYPEGIGGARKTRWFRPDAPMTWQAARDQLVAAGLIDRDAISPNQAGYWRLVTDSRVFTPTRAKSMPAGHRDAARSARFSLDGGRVIVRGGVRLVRLERVDLGDNRYALSPHETDEFGARIVRSLNRRGAK
ncbi:MAG: hypothetical protein QM831_21440 [Kofleriaceae bacterium]